MSTRPAPRFQLDDQVVAGPGTFLDPPPEGVGEVTSVHYCQEHEEWHYHVRFPGASAQMIEQNMLPAPSVAADEIPDDWQGTEPAEGTRRALIRNALRANGIFGRGRTSPNEPDVESLRLADAVESALLKSTIADEEREADAQEAIANVGEVLDAIDAPQAPTYAQRIQRLYTELEDQRESRSTNTEESADAPSKPEGSRADGDVDMRPPDEWDIGQAARERLYERLTDGPIPNPAELARVIDILR